MQLPRLDDGTLPHPLSHLADVYQPLYCTPAALRLPTRTLDTNPQPQQLVTILKNHKRAPEHRIPKNLQSQTVPIPIKIVLNTAKAHVRLIHPTSIRHANHRIEDLRRLHSHHVIPHAEAKRRHRRVARVAVSAAGFGRVVDRAGDGGVVGVADVWVEDQEGGAGVGDADGGVEVVLEVVVDAEDGADEGPVARFGVDWERGQGAGVGGGRDGAEGEVAGAIFAEADAEGGVGEGGKEVVEEGLLWVRLDLGGLVADGEERGRKRTAIDAAEC